MMNKFLINSDASNKRPLVLFVSIITILLIAACGVRAPAVEKSAEAASTLLPSTVTPSSTSTFTPPPTATVTASPTPTTSPSPTPTTIPGEYFSFALTSDMSGRVGPGEFDTSQHFRGACEKIIEIGGSHFMISPGDVSPPWDTRWTIDQTFGEDYLWYPMVGNHDVWDSTMQYLRDYDYDPNGDTPPNLVHQGPPDCEETTFSFDYGSAHFALLNVYCDTASDVRTDGAIVDALYEWLAADLEATEKEHIFVLGHEPAFPQPDVDNLILRHDGDSLDKYSYTRDRFWNLLQEHQVTAYIHGHTHGFSAVDFDGVWQLDEGHAMGAREQAMLSTFVLVHVDGSRVTYDTYRSSREGEYTLRYSGVLRE
jgi:hypothetical protein